MASCFGRVTPERFDELLAQRREAADERRRFTSRAIPAPLSLGADEVADAIAREAARREHRYALGAQRLARTVLAGADGRGRDRARRVAYGPVTPPTSASLFDAGLLDGGDHRLRLGLTEEIPYLKNQERLTFARVGIIDPVSLDDYLAHGGYRGLDALRSRCPARKIVEEVTASDCADAAARAFPRNQMEDHAADLARDKNTSSATPTKATPAPSPIA